MSPSLYDASCEERKHKSNSLPLRFLVFWRTCAGLVSSLPILQWRREPRRIKDDLSPQHLSPQSRCYCFLLAVNSVNHSAHRERRKWNSLGLPRTGRRCSEAERFNEDWPAPPLLNHNKSWKNDSPDTFPLSLLLRFVFSTVLFDTLGCVLQFILVYITFP